MSEPKDKPDTTATVSGWLQDHDDGKLTTHDSTLAKDANDADTGRNTNDSNRR